jgi:hypothetical protein
LTVGTFRAKQIEMPLFIVESYAYSVDHGRFQSAGVIGEPKGSEKIYLHVLALTPAELAALAPRVDEDGNKEHARLALPGNEEFWVAVDGEVAWPKILRPRLVSKCDLTAGTPTPVPLGAEDIDRLRKAGAVLPAV